MHRTGLGQILNHRWSPLKQGAMAKGQVSTLSEIDFHLKAGVAITNKYIQNILCDNFRRSRHYLQGLIYCLVLPVARIVLNCTLSQRNWRQWNNTSCASSLTCPFDNNNKETYCYVIYVSGSNWSLEVIAMRFFQIGKMGSRVVKLNVMSQRPTSNMILKTNDYRLILHVKSDRISRSAAWVTKILACVWDNAIFTDHVFFLKTGHQRAQIKTGDPT